MSKAIYHNKVFDNKAQESTMLNVTTQKNNFERFSIQSAFSKILVTGDGIQLLDIGHYLQSRRINLLIN